MNLRYLGAEAIRDLMPMTRCIDVMRTAMAAMSNGLVFVPQRMITPLHSGSGALALMPASSTAPDVFAVKALSLMPQNPSNGRPAIQGLVVLFDGTTGAPTAVFDGAEITALRTAATSGLATALLARPDVRTHGVIGTGVQASRHIDAITAARPAIREVLLWGRSTEKAQALAASETIRTGLEVRAVADVCDAAACDVVSAVTGATQPVLAGSALRSGAHVNLVGSHKPDAREADTECITRARVYVDLKSSALAEAGDLLIPVAESAVTAEVIIGELGELILNRIAGRRSVDEITVFKSVGIAAQDLFTAAAVLERMDDAK